MAKLIADPFRAARLILLLRQNGLTHGLLLKAMETIDRGGFVGPEHSELAFEDVHLPLPCGQTLPPPLAIARLIDAMAFEETPSGRTLLIGAGSGYTAALLSYLSEHVVAVERLKTLADAARGRLVDLSVRNVSVHHSDGLEGLPAHGPYDRILFLGAVSEFPEMAVQALSRDGRWVAPISTADALDIYNGPGDDGFVGPLGTVLTPLRPGVSERL